MKRIFNFKAHPVEIKQDFFSTTKGFDYRRGKDLLEASILLRSRVLGAKVWAEEKSDPYSIHNIL